MKLVRRDGVVLEPPYLASTLEMLRKGFPDFIPEEDYFPLIQVMDDDEMSNRNIAAVLGCYCGESYMNFLHDVGHVAPNIDIDRNEVTRVESKLIPFGLDEWREEE